MTTDPYRTADALDAHASTSRFALSMKEAARAYGVSERTIWAEIAAGHLRAAKVGRRVLVTVDALRDWIDSKSKTAG